MTTENKPTDDLIQDAAAQAVEQTDVAEPVAQDDAALTKQLADQERQLQESGDRLKRLQADFENYRRRTRQEKEDLAAVVVQNFIKELLPLLDNFERALATVNPEAGANPLRDGVEMIFKQFMTTLEKNGLEKIEAVNAKFDPNFHEAVMRVSDDSVEEDTVVEELQCGYSVKGRVVRPSMVKVAAN